jgi:hypothetical protein
VNLADNETTLITYNLTIDAKNINSIIVDNKSTSSFTNSKISNFLTGANVKNRYKAFFVDYIIQNEQDRDNLQLLNILNASHVQAIETNFVKCREHGIVSSTSFLNISNCNFAEFQQCLLNFQNNSNTLIQNYVLINFNDNFNLFYFNESKCYYSDCSFSDIHPNSLYIVNCNAILLKYSTFNQCNFDFNKMRLEQLVIVG